MSAVGEPKRANWADDTDSDEVEEVTSFRVYHAAVYDVSFCRVTAVQVYLSVTERTLCWAGTGVRIHD